MGEAKRREEAYAAGLPHRPPRVCPNCKSIRIERATLPATGLLHRKTDYDLCRGCGAVWEAYPDDWCEDVVGADPCDNCAFRPGSPEQADPAEWRKLVALLRSGQEFRCHKGAPILGLTDDPPNTRFDAAWVNRRGRKCAGFMRMVWTMREKGEDWLGRNLEFVGAPGYDCPLPNAAAGGEEGEPVDLEA
jgi:hypothetical protein